MHLGSLWSEARASYLSVLRAEVRSTLSLILRTFDLVQKGTNRWSPQPSALCFVVKTSLTKIRGKLRAIRSTLVSGPLSHIYWTQVCSKLMPSKGTKLYILRSKGLRIEVRDVYTFEKLYILQRAKMYILLKSEAKATNGRRPVTFLMLWMFCTYY
jgi:hypothetical protein